MLLKLFVLLLGTVSVNADTVQRANLTIYYESYCPGCIETYPEIADIVRKLGDRLELHTLPFGNGEFTGNRTIKCYYGEEECYGNKLHACAIDQLKETKTYVEYNSCMIQNKSDDTSADSCGQKLNINSGVVSAIKSCAKSNKGQDLVIAYGHQTDKDLANKDRYTPYITINGQPMDPYTIDILQDVCKTYDYDNRPEACNYQ